MSATKLLRRTGSVGSRMSGLGHFRPDNVVTNADLSQIMDTDDEWIRSRVGIAERRFAGEDDTVISMGARASAKAIAEAGIAPTDIDTVIVATCTLESPVPHAATQIAGALGIHAPGSFDINAACAGFCYGVAAADQAIRAGTSSTVLVVGSERLTAWTDPKDRATAIIFADGAGAVVITGSDESEIGPVVWGSDETHIDAIRIDSRNGTFYQEGQTVFRWATTKIGAVAIRAAEAAGVDLADIDALVTHQANLRIIDATARRMGIGKDKVMINIQRYGNTTGATIPLCLWEWEKKLKKGENIILAAFGGGFTWGSIWIKWAYDS